ncbi:MAG: YidC/Oxa1 family membrane protein insertase [Gemmatimonadales bacterium]
MTAVLPLLGSTLGKIFQPLFQAMAWLIAFFYALVPNYALAIGLLTVVVMVVTAPLTVKSTKSMASMQRLSPELKKLQQKYKGDRQKLNEEMMNLYKEHGVNPAGGCLPMIIQFPVFIILYDVIRGLTNTVKIHGVLTAAPRYIGHSTKLYENLKASKGKMPAFGIDLAARVFGHHSFTAALPYIILVAVAIGLQYVQMRQLNSRNKAMAQANPQAQMMQRYMPLVFAVIYLNISAGVNVYFIVSTLCRIGIQEAVFRSGTLDRVPTAGETRLPGRGGPGGAAPKRKSLMERLGDAQQRAIEAQQQRQAALQGGDVPPQAPSGQRDGKPGGTRPGGTRPAGTASPGGTAGAGGGGKPGGVGSKPGTGGAKSSGSGTPAANGGPQGKGGPQGSKAKRTRKGR